MSKTAEQELIPSPNEFWRLYEACKRIDERIKKYQRPKKMSKTAEDEQHKTLSDMKHALLILIVLTLSSCFTETIEFEPVDLFYIEIVKNGAEIVPYRTPAMIYHAPTFAETRLREYKISGLCLDRRFLRDKYFINYVRVVYIDYEADYAHRLVEEIDKF